MTMQKKKYVSMVIFIVRLYFMVNVRKANRLNRMNNEKVMHHIYRIRKKEEEQRAHLCWKVQAIYYDVSVKMLSIFVYGYFNFS